MNHAQDVLGLSTLLTTQVADLAGPSRSNLARMVTMNRAILG
eukprot:CAMPEP_0118883430 /NCGR_PEP_ID=MMETSP1163-20130328/22497_1 /TAXON_ID=124430 /ORGANISM="Phaeomonas parva, Strain CCMP2877" /LENGTH=41 /DNA_ID= /DNA_START= /DNA_END= /DNA_ORIENTATION=